MSLLPGGPGIPDRVRHLPSRLAGAGVPAVTAPLEAWRALRAIEGDRTTIVDLYALVAAERGLAATELPAKERLDLWHAVAADIWPGFSTTDNSGRRGDPIIVVDYDPSWIGMFGQWRDRITGALGDVALRIEHVGSTSVPGLAAKPRIDIQVSVFDTEDEDGYVPQIESIGVQLRSRDELHRYFRPFPGLERDVQVHVCRSGSAWERDHLLFRDYLRTHDEARDLYASTKRINALVWHDDGVGYTEAKTDVILDILEKAAAWDAAGRP